MGTGLSEEWVVWRLLEAQPGGKEQGPQSCSQDVAAFAFGRGRIKTLLLRAFIGIRHKTTYLKLQAVRQLKGVIKHDSPGLFSYAQIRA